jgi:hypothetical protein
MVERILECGADPYFHSFFFYLSPNSTNFISWNIITTVDTTSLQSITRNRERDANYCVKSAIAQVANPEVEVRSCGDKTA